MRVYFPIFASSCKQFKDKIISTQSRTNHIEFIWIYLLCQITKCSNTIFNTQVYLDIFDYIKKLQKNSNNLMNS